jgi:folate-binding Fe-S cluster repair protein YgfZ
VLNVARYQWLCPADKAAAAWVSLSSQLQPTNTADWNLSEIQAGIAHINQLTQEKFVPQMINFELVGGVNFKKAAIRVRRSLPAASIWANSNAA